MLTDTEITAPDAGAESTEEQPEAPEAPKPSRFDLLRSDKPLDEIKSELAAERGETAPGAEGEGEGDGAADAEGGATETQTPARDPATGRFVAAAEGQAEGEGEGSEAGGEETAADQPPVLRIAGRRRGDPDVEVPVDLAAAEAAGLDVSELQERVGQAQNTVGRYADYVAKMTALESDRAELRTIEERLQAPDTAADFLLEHVQPSIREALVQKLLVGLDDEGFERVVGRASEWTRDPDARREQRLNEREQRLTREEQARTGGERGISDADRQAAAAVVTAIAELTPDEWPDRRRARFLDASRRALIDYVEEQDLQEIDPAKVPTLLGRLGILEDYGLTAADSADPAPPNGPASRAQLERAQRTGEEIRTRAERRKNAATAPAGAGPVLPDGNRPPKGQTPEQRFAWIRGGSK